MMVIVDGGRRLDASRWSGVGVGVGGDRDRDGRRRVVVGSSW
jgi:hypothetical protein